MTAQPDTRITAPENVKKNLYIEGFNNRQRDPTFTPRLGRDSWKQKSQRVDTANGFFDQFDKKDVDDDQIPLPMYPPRLGRQFYNENELRRLMRRLQIFV